MNAKPARLENIVTDKGKVPVYATGVVDQPWDDYSDVDHGVWKALYQRQREILVGRASDEFLQAQDMMGMSPDRIPRFAELNAVLEAATDWTIVGVFASGDFLHEIQLQQQLRHARSIQARGVV